MGISGIIKKMTTQTAVYWGDPSPDGYGGTLFGSMYPIEIECRWQQKRELTIDDEGKEIASESQVYVDQDVDIGGYLYLGSLDDLDSSEEADPFVADGAFEIKNFEKSPELRKTNRFIRKAYLYGKRI